MSLSSGESGNRGVVAAMVDALNEADIDRFVSYYTDDVEVEISRFGRRKGARAVGEWIEDARCPRWILSESTGTARRSPWR